MNLAHCDDSLPSHHAIIEWLTDLLTDADLARLGRPHAPLDAGRLARWPTLRQELLDCRNLIGGNDHAPALSPLDEMVSHLSHLHARGAPPGEWRSPWPGSLIHAIRSLEICRQPSKLYAT